MGFGGAKLKGRPPSSYTTAPTFNKQPICYRSCPLPKLGSNHLMCPASQIFLNMHLTSVLLFVFLSFHGLCHKNVWTNYLPTDKWAKRLLGSWQELVLQLSFGIITVSEIMLLHPGFAVTAVNRIFKRICQARVWRTVTNRLCWLFCFQPKNLNLLRALTPALVSCEMQLLLQTMLHFSVPRVHVCLRSRYLCFRLTVQHCSIWLGQSKR